MTASKLVAAEAQLSKARGRFASQNKLCYHYRVSAKKALIRCASLLEFAAKSRNRTVCGFFHGTSYGGAVGRGASSCRFSLRELPGLSHPTALPPDVRVGRQSSNATLEATMANSALTPVEFHGASLFVTLIDNVPFVAIKPITEELGLDWKAQHARISRHQVLSSTMVVTTTVAEDGKQRDMVMLPLDKLNGWLFGVSVTRCKPELRPRLIEYQAECFDVLARHFGAVKPHVSALPEPSIKNRRWLVSFDHNGSEQIQPIDWDDCLLKYEELPRLLKAHDNMISTDLLVAIGNACFERLQTRIGGFMQSDKMLRTKIQSMASA